MEKSNYPRIKMEELVLQKENLRKYTFARVAQPKSGHSVSITEILALKADHAAAKDAIFTFFEIQKIQADLNGLDLDFCTVSSKVDSREIYLQRPDWGRLLNDKSIKILKNQDCGFDISLIIADGLSALGVNRYAAPLLKILVPKLKNAGYTIAPIIFAQNARVALADPIAEIFQARVSVILIGERPGLSSPDSMGAYLTYAPQTGLTDESRNCISNIRDKGLPPQFAAEKLFYLMHESITRKLSGVLLKDEMNMLNNT